MCGIFGVGYYKGKSTINDIATYLLKGLKRLEYRGYDSAGVCIQTVDNERKIVKRQGNVSVLHNTIFGTTGDSSSSNENSSSASASSGSTSTKELPSLDSISGGIGMAHTRWATHGPPSDLNAHPQSSDDDNNFAVIHNGIMTNFADMKSLLSQHGYTFKSDTDTEIIAKLASYLYNKHEAKTPANEPKLTFVELMAEVFKLCEGANAMICMSKHYPGELVVMKRGSPMICGYQHITEEGVAKETTTSTTIDHAKKIQGEGLVSFDDSPCRVFFSSDAQALAEYTKQVVYLDDNDVVHFSQKDGTLAFYKLESEMLSRSAGRSVSDLEMELESLSKGGYAHFMLKEINEQVQSVVNTMRGRINFSEGQITMGGFASKTNRNAILSARRIMFIACGTSLNACIAVRPLFDELAGCPTAIENASDFLDRSPRIFRDDVCFFVSQSGETADVLRALEYCREAGAVLVGMTNTVGSSISRMTHFGAHLNCGPEIGVASTKAFSSQVVTLMLIALMLCDDIMSKQQRRTEILRGLEQLSGHIGEALRGTEEKIKKIAASLVPAKSFLIIGRGYQFATCLEAALKVKELSYIHTEGINAGELKHGPLALIDENTPVMIICTKDHLVERSRAAVQQIRARNGKCIVLLSDPDPEIEALAEEVIRVPATVDCLQVLVNAIPMQLLAYHVAVLKGNNVDCPRNLAKSVTVQ